MTTLPIPSNQILAVAVVAVLVATFTVLLWRIARSYRARRVVRCPVRDAAAVVALRIDATGAPLAVVSCSLLDPPYDVTCSQSCLHVADDACEHLSA